MLLEFSMMLGESILHGQYTNVLTVATPESRLPKQPVISTTDQHCLLSTPMNSPYQEQKQKDKWLREERGDAERALALDHKPRDLSSHNGSSNGHSPVLNLSKTAGSGSVGEHSGSEAGASHRSQDDEEEDDNLSEDLEDENEKDEDLSDVPENLPLPAPGSESPQALNYSQIASAAVAVSQGAQDPSVSSTETLLRNIQGLLKVAADNARQQERQINYEKALPEPH
ncbi:hypothetical protein HZH68_013440 [Vespula germanica]|uniref:Dachshund n=1 Tax=Vespula germanica TaxID=30212 RepID=A0A834JCV0_VESGE|nr:hypothetical protein HZH68_013440 [Vespula germanica]